MVYAYYAVSVTTPQALFPSMWFQFADDSNGASNLFYGFPPVPWGPPDMACIAVDAASRKVRDPKDRQPGPSEVDLANVQAFIKKHCRGVTLAPNMTGSCLQVNVHDNNFVLDYLPNTKGKVAIFCAGWAMKFVPLLGTILKQMVLDGGTSYDISHFKITRPGVLVTPPSDGSSVAEEEHPHVMQYHGSAQPKYGARGGH